MSIIGNQLTSLQRVAGYPRFTDDGTTYRLVDQYVCKYTSVTVLLPLRGSAHPDFAGYWLKTREWVKDGDAAIVTLTYGIDGVGEPIPDGAEVVSTDAVVDVESNGQLVPSIVYRRVRVKTVWTFSAGTSTLNVGTRISPPGLSGAGANEWLKTARIVEKTGEGTRVTDEYKWRSGGWDTTLYSAGSNET